MFNNKIFIMISVVLSLGIVYSTTGHSAVTCISNTDKVPITDLGQPYMPSSSTVEYQGGLYPNGLNKVPPDHETEGIKRAALIEARCFNGNLPDTDAYPPTGCPDPAYCFNGNLADTDTYPDTGCPPETALNYCPNGELPHSQYGCLEGGTPTNCPNGSPYHQDDNNCLLADNCPNGLPYDQATNDCKSPKIALLTVGYSQTTLAVNGGIEGAGYDELQNCYENDPAELVPSFQTMAETNKLEPAYVKGSFVHQAMESGMTRPDLVILDGGLGSQGSDSWVDAYVNQSPICNHTIICSHDGARGGPWTRYDYLCQCRLGNITEAQVQAVWVQAASLRPGNLLPSEDAEAYILLEELGDIVKSLQERYKNLKVVFISSSEYAGQMNREPYSYEYGYSFKWLIDEQIRQMGGDNSVPILYSDGTPVYSDLSSFTGTLDHTEKRCSKTTAQKCSDNADCSSPTCTNCQTGEVCSLAPWLSWGPYMWADGTIQRNDGLSWECSENPPDYSDFQYSNAHLSCDGVDKYGDNLLGFFKNSQFAIPWFCEYDNDGNYQAIRIDSSYQTSSSLQAAYNNAQDSQIIYSHAGIFEELNVSPLYISEQKSVEIDGGYNCDYSCDGDDNGTGCNYYKSPRKTVFKGDVRINSGRIKLSNFRILKSGI